MLNYSAKQEEPSFRRSAVAPPADRRALSVEAIRQSINCHKLLVALSAISFGIAGVVLEKAWPQRYAATVQIYVDPRALPGVDSTGAQQGEDANGFVNYVESLSLIIKSRSVMQRVVSTEKLTQDSEFVGGAGLFSRGSDPARDVAQAQIESAMRTLENRVAVKRPERTYVIDISVSSRDAEKAARLADATARAFIEAQTAMRADAARQAEETLAARLQSLRARVAASERKVADFKEQKELVGAQDRLLTEHQLAEINRQLTLSQVRADDARARYEQAAALRSRGGDVGAVAVALNLATLTPLRAQQDEAHQKLGDLTAELGPRHPLVKDAQARAQQADGAVRAELARIIDNSRFELAKAEDFEKSLGAKLEELKTQTYADDRALIGLHEAEREADAARKDYELFDTRSRQSGDIQQVDAALPNIRIVSFASIPVDPSLPPRASVMGAGGVFLGLAAGIAFAYVRERREGVIAVKRRAFMSRRLFSIVNLLRNWSSASGLLRSRKGALDSEPGQGDTHAVARRAPSIAVGVQTPLRRRLTTQNPSRIDLTAIGLSTLHANDDPSEFRKIGEAFGLYPTLRRADRGPRILGVVGLNGEGLRSSLAVNLALTAARDGFRVALVDAVPAGSALTAAVIQATRNRAKTRGAFYNTDDNILLVLLSLDRHLAVRSRPERMLRDLRCFPNQLDLVVCDCPDEREGAATLIVGEVDDLVVLEERSSPLGSPISPVGVGAAPKVRATVRLVVQSGQQAA